MIGASFCSTKTPTQDEEWEAEKSLEGVAL